MWKSSEYCDVQLNWNSNHDPSFIATYASIQNGDTDNWYSAIPELLPSSQYLQCTSTSDETQSSPELRTICKPYNAVSIFGVDVISEARVLEVYSDMDGYLLSCKGEPMEDLDGNKNKVFNCRFTVEEPVTSITIKFLGLDDKLSFAIQRLHFALVERPGPMGGQTETGIDLNKVKGYLHSMGDVMSENAQDLLSSVEKYQQTQMLGMSSLQDALSGSRSQVGQLGGIGQLTGLLSMFSQFSSVGMVTKGQRNHENTHGAGDRCHSGTEKCEQTKNDDTHLQENKSTNSEHVNVSVTGDEAMGNENRLGQCNANRVSPLERLLRKPLASQGHDENEGQDDMYKMLQGICGSVSALRLRSHKEETEQSQEEPEARENGKERLHENTSTIPDVSMTTDMHDIAKVIGQTVLQEVKDCEQRLKDYIDTSLLTMETKINTKLDMILKLLNKDNEARPCDT